MSSPMNATKHLRKKLCQPSTISFSRQGQREYFQIDSMKPVLPLPKPDKDITRKEKYKSISLVNRDAKLFNKVLADQIQRHIKRIIHHNQDLILAILCCDPSNTHFKRICLNLKRQVRTHVLASSERECILVSQACHSKILQTRWLEQQRFIFSHFQRLEVQHQGVRRFGFSKGFCPWLASGRSLAPYSHGSPL